MYPRSKLQYQSLSDTLNFTITPKLLVAIGQFFQLTVRDATKGINYIIYELPEGWTGVNAVVPVGNSVVIRFYVENIGDLTSTFSVAIQDKDTGNVLWSGSGSAAPGTFYSADANIGVMPNKNWNLTIVVSP